VDTLSAINTQHRRKRIRHAFN